MKKIISLTLLLATSATVFSNSPTVFRSSSRAAHVIELYSSEGCSSCPPAEAWVGTLRNEAGLWKNFIPVEFHVDYWNRLGWTDPYSKATFTTRQNGYASEWQQSHVYTPAFSLDGKEWRTGIFGGRAVPTSLGAVVGVLEVTQARANRFEVNFEPQEAGGDWEVTAVLLGNGLVSEITAGENARRKLAHEFVVLQLKTEKLNPRGKVWSATLELNHDRDVRPASYSIAVWVSKRGSQQPLQAVGGDLPFFKSVPNLSLRSEP